MFVYFLTYIITAPFACINKWAEARIIRKYNPERKLEYMDNFKATQIIFSESLSNMFGER